MDAAAADATQKLKVLMRRRSRRQHRVPPRLLLAHAKVEDDSPSRRPFGRKVAPPSRSRQGQFLGARVPRLEGDAGIVCDRRGGQTRGAARDAVGSQWRDSNEIERRGCVMRRASSSWAAWAAQLVRKELSDPNSGSECLTSSRNGRDEAQLERTQRHAKGCGRCGRRRRFARSVWRVEVASNGGSGADVDQNAEAALQAAALAMAPHARRRTVILRGERNHKGMATPLGQARD